MITTTTVYTAYIRPMAFSSSGTKYLSKRRLRILFFFSRFHPIESSVSSGGAAGEDVSALPGQMIASSSVTLRARSSRSACKSWNICKLTSYQRATRGLCEVGGWVGGWRHQAESRGAARDCSHSLPAGRYSGSVSAPAFDPCLKLTLPQASYSP